MDSVKCRTLLEVIELGNIHAAAESLGYTPSGISKMMSSLEQELGMTLLVRSKRGVQPTQACLQIFPAIRHVASAGEALNRAVSDCLGLSSGVLRIGIAYPQFYPPLIEVLDAFRQDHPGVTVTLKEANSTPLAELVAAGELDLAIISQREGDFEWEELVEDKLVVVVSEDHPLVQAAKYPLIRLEEDPFIEVGPNEDADNTRVLANLGIKPNIQCSVSNDETARKLVQAGLGVALTNQLLTQDVSERVTVLPTKPEVSVAIGIAYTSPHIASPAAREFTDMLLQRLSNEEQIHAGSR